MRYFVMSVETNILHSLHCRGQTLTQVLNVI